MGMKAALVTSNSGLKSFGAKIGFTVFQLNEFNETGNDCSGKSADIVVSGLLKLLGFHGGKMVEPSEYDLVFVHMGAGEKDNALTSDMENINALVGSLVSITQPGSEVGMRLHLSVVMSYGCEEETDKSNLSILSSTSDLGSDLLNLIPRQSYTMKGENPRGDVR